MHCTRQAQNGDAKDGRELMFAPVILNALSISGMSVGL